MQVSSQMNEDRWLKIGTPIKNPGMEKLPSITSPTRGSPYGKEAVMKLLNTQRM